MAVGDTYPDSGGTRKICIGRPATEDQAGWAALGPWTTVKGIIQMPDRGDSITDAGEMTLDDGRKNYLPGSKDGGRLSIPFQYIEGDAGQTLLFANKSNNATISWQEVDADGKATYWYGKSLGIRRRQSTPNSMKAYILDIGVNSGRFEGTPDET